MDHEQYFEIEEDFDSILPNFNVVVGNILLELREHFNVIARKCPKILTQIKNFLVGFLENHL